ncbi:YihY/virulence factor BrkB family protein [Primorskyibacter sp. S187A]|uniref:YihY/virulence factor BrkB family protein n=1 Tax=Primorskyibacter sp. S187A TaxID=3415130 RepID=UPI003C7B7346
MSRGRAATSPQEIPRAGLLDVALRICRQQGKQNLSLIAAGIAFYGLLSLFPGITAGVALAGLIFDRDLLVQQSHELAALLPAEAREIIMGQLREVVSADDTALSLAALAGLGVALYSSSRAMANFIAGLNIIYEEEETRGFFALKATTLALTGAFLLGLILAASVAAVIPVVVSLLGAAQGVTDLVMLVRWPVLLCLSAAGIALLYRYGPDRRAAKWRWLTPGAGLACVLWVLGTLGFSVYVQSFGTYNETFGALGGVIILLTWLWLSAFIVLMGALIDAELEAQTGADSTIGKSRPRGERGAVKADKLGALRGEPNDTLPR